MENIESKFASKNLTMGEMNAIVKKLGGEENARKFLRNELIVSELFSRIIKIDRSQPFNPTVFIGGGWSIEEQDEKALALTEIDLTKVVFKTTLEKGERSIKGEDKLKRLKEKNVVRLDAGIFQTLWENQHLIPEKWKKKINGRTIEIFFDGTILRGSNGVLMVMCLYWCDGKWHWSYQWLVDNFVHVGCSSAVLAS